MAGVITPIIPRDANVSVAAGPPNVVVERYLRIAINTVTDNVIQFVSISRVAVKFSLPEAERLLPR